MTDSESSPPEQPPESRPPQGVPRRSKPEPETDSDTDKKRSTSGPWLILLVLGGILLLFLFQPSPESTGTHVDDSFFRNQLAKGNVEEVRFHREVLTGKWKKIPSKKEAGDQVLEIEFNTVLPPESVRDNQLVPLLRKHKVKFDSEKTSVGLGSQLLLWLLVPLLMFGLFWFFMMRRNSDPMGGGMMGNFIRSPAKRFHATEQQTTFDDVAAMEQAKVELMEVVEFLKEPEKFQRLGARIPKGVLLMGPPGTGKTLLARAVAGEAEVPFYSINGSEFIQMFVGVGASRVRDLFRTAKEHSPCIIFIDEIDAVGRVRGAGLGGGHDEREQTLNQILGEMDGFMQHESVIVLAATNRPDVLDPALLRPGRFDRHVTIDLPTKNGREAILKIHARNVPLADDVDLAEIAAGTIGFSGADLRNLVNESALMATRSEKKQVEREDFEMAHDKVLMGPKREEVLTGQEREMTAYHEAGHALLAWLLPDADLVHKVTIIPRGRALGVTQLLPDEDRYNIGEKRLHTRLKFIMGGRAAEKLVFDEYSAGAEDDLKKATQLARRMVGYWGMSEVIGPVAFRHSEEHPFLGKEMSEQRDFSDETARLIDQEVQRFLISAADEAREILSKHRDKLDCLARGLLEKESLGSQDITELIGESGRALAAASAENSVT